MGFPIDFDRAETVALTTGQHYRAACGYLHLAGCETVVTVARTVVASSASCTRTAHHSLSLLLCPHSL